MSLSSVCRPLYIPSICTVLRQPAIISQLCQDRSRPLSMCTRLCRIWQFTSTYIQNNHYKFKHIKVSFPHRHDISNEIKENLLSDAHKHVKRAKNYLCYTSKRRRFPTVSAMRGSVTNTCQVLRDVFTVRPFDGQPGGNYNDQNCITNHGNDADNESVDIHISASDLNCYMAAIYFTTLVSISTNQIFI